MRKCPTTRRILVLIIYTELAYTLSIYVALRHFTKCFLLVIRTIIFNTRIHLVLNKLSSFFPQESSSTIFPKLNYHLLEQLKFGVAICERNSTAAA